MPISSPQVIVITGATAGLGLATTKALRDAATEPTVIILTSRNPAKGQSSIDQAFGEASSHGDVKIIVKELLLDEDESVEKFRGEIAAEYGKIDVLINNAAAHLDMSIGEGPGKLTVREAFNTSCNTNIASTYLFTQSLIPLLLESPTRRLIFISTGISSLADHGDTNISINQSPPEGWPKKYQFNVMTYRTSKAGLNMMALEWARVLRHDKVKIHILDPGLLATTLGGQIRRS